MVEPVDARGSNKRLSIDAKQKIFDCCEISTVTVDRCSGRDHVYMPKKDFARKYGDLKMPVVRSK